MPLYEGIGLINEKHPVVLEIGTVYAKAGFAGETSPRCIVPSRIRNKAQPGSYIMLKDYKDTSDLYQMLVEFLQFLYCKHLLVTPKDRKVVVVESIFAKTEYRETLARVLFFHYEVLNVLWLPSQLAAVSSTGWDTGLVVDVGYEDATVLPVFKGVTLLNAVQTHAIGALKFDQVLESSVIENCTNPPDNLTELLTPHILEDLRVRTCFVNNRARTHAKSFCYELNGENFLELNGIVREAPAEIWFQNKDLDGESLPQMILEALSKCPIDTRKALAKSLVLTGGTIMLPGFRKRLLEDLSQLTIDRHGEFQMEPTEYRIFNLPTNENSAAWLGGAIYGATEAMTLRGLSKEAFLKSGVVPDWSNLIYNNLRAFSSGQSTPAGSPSKSL